MKKPKSSAPVHSSSNGLHKKGASYNTVLQEAKEHALNYPQISPMPGKTRGSDSDTDSGGSDVDMDRDNDSDTAQVDVDEEEEGQEEEEEVHETDEEPEVDDEYPTIMWTGYGKKTPVLLFKPDAIVSKKPEYRTIGDKYHLSFKIFKTECKLVRQILNGHGFHEAHPNSSDFNLLWTGSHLKPYVLRSMQEFQKVNHFPRSYEITRKDRLFKNIQRMQQTKGFKHFDFVPHSFIVPAEFQDFCAHYLKDKGPYIVKPIASSRGRGIFLVNHPEQVPLDDTMIVSKYIAHPLLIDGFKFDLRLYVGVTSYDPLIVYMYEEGMARFATVKYQNSSKTIRNTMMHLTNYSINKKNQDFVKNEDPDVEDYGNKWTLGALLRLLRQQGKDTTAMMMRIEDVIIKTLVSAELPIATACKMFMPFKGNCFELYGFDILVDENLRPWVLEVNLSPSLACDAPVDLKIKGNMLTDLFTLVGFTCHDPMMRKVNPQGKTDFVPPSRASTSRQGSAPPRRPASSMSNPNSRIDSKWRPKNRPGSASSLKGGRPSPNQGGAGPNMRGTGLTGDEIKTVRRAKEEYQRRAGWIRIFPSADSWELYSSYMQYTTTNNLMLWQQLFPERARNTLSLKPSTAAYSSNLARAKNVHLHSAQYPQLYISTQDDALAQALQRSLQYERRLHNLGERGKRRRQRSRAKGKFNPKIPLAQGVEIDVEQEGSDQNGTAAKPPPGTRRLARTPSDPQYTDSSRGSSKMDLKSDTPSQSSVTSSRLESRDSLRTDDTASKTDSKSEVNGRDKSRSYDDSHPRDHPRDQSPGQPPQLPKQPKFHYNVVELLEKRRTMTKLQARHAFSAYLTRILYRMIHSTQPVDDEMEASFDLVLRFLKRAAGNLQQPVKVVVPSRKLALNDRRRILAKQLGDFVHVYNKETEQLRQRNIIEKKCLKRPDSKDALDEDKFNKFVTTASEGELEEVLTTYTKLNKSASIFLGSNSKSSNDRPVSQPEPSLLKRREQSEESLDTRPEDVAGYNQYCGSTHDLADRPPPSSTLHRSPSQSSYASAVSIYTTKQRRQRPSSASSTSSRGSIRSRPNSAGHSRPTSASSTRNLIGQREKPDGAESMNPHEEVAINSALQRIAIRQQQRQYVAPKGSNVLNSNDNTPRDVNDPDYDNISVQSESHSEINVEVNGHALQSNVEHYPLNHSSRDSRPSTRGETVINKSVGNLPSTSARRNTSRQSGRSLRSANDTFDSFVEDLYRDPAHDIASAYSKVTGVHPVNRNYTPTFHSTQFQITQHQQMMKQQRMIEQSQALLESSKAKHQEMIAQAHQAKRSNGQGEMDHVYIPQPPPPKPAGDRRTVGAHRMARTQMSEDAFKYNTTPSPSNKQRVIYSSSYNTGL